jgi:hypothetical protein
MIKATSWRTNATVIVVLLFLAWLSFGSSEKDRMSIATLTTDMQTVCLGRYLIDLPRDFQFEMSQTAQGNSFSPEGMSFQDAPEIRLDVMAKPQPLEEFKQQIQSLTQAKRNPRPSNPAYPAIVLSESMSDTALLLRHKEVNILKPNDESDNQSRNSEIRFWIDGLAVTASAVSHEGAFAVVEQHLKAFVQNVQVYDPKFSQGPGFCVGPLLVKGRYGREYLSGHVRSDKHPDLIINMELMTHGSGRERSLLDRANDPKNLLSVFDVGYSTLRKGKVQVAGQPGQELGVRFSSKDRKGNALIEHKFMLEVDPPSPEQTQLSAIDLGLVTGAQDLRDGSPTKGQQFSSTLSDAEVIGVWDAITKSIRVRPGAL